jgi:predicted  nucleic acid-binding Zn-ribbon protein
MKAIVNDKKHLTLVSHTNGVVIVEESGCIIDLDFQSLGSIFELADLGNTYTIKDCDEIETLKADNNELTERIEFLEKQLTNSGDRVTELRNQIIGLTSELNIRGQRISQLNDELNCRDKIIKEKTKRLIELENVEYELNKCRETNNALTEKLESKTSDLAERTYWFRYYRRAFRAVKEYLKPNEKYDLDSSGYNIVNSIDSKFIISFKDTSIASKAFNELRYSISPRTVLLKYENDIVEYNVDAMNIYFIEANTPTVIRKFNDENFTITCCDVYTAEITNALLNCGFPASDIVSTYKSYIAFSNIN